MYLFVNSLANAQDDGLTIKVIKTGSLSSSEATGDDTDYSSDLATYYYNSNISGMNVLKLEMHNNTGSDINWRIMRYMYPDVSSSWTNQICNAFCPPYSTNNPYCSPESNNIDLPNGGTKEIEFHVTPGEIQGTGTFTLFFGPDCDTYMDSITIQMTYTVGIEELDETSLIVTPNPANDFLSFETSFIGQEITATIFDLAGNLVTTQEITKNQKIEISQLVEGIYFVQLSQGNKQSITRKVVVKH